MTVEEAPKKKRKPRLKKTGMTATVKVDLSLVPGVLSQKPQRIFLRTEAQAAYLMDLDGISAEALYDTDSRFHVVSRKVFLNWALADRWFEKRQKAYAQLHAKLEAEVSANLTERLYYEVQGLNTMKRRANELLGQTPPKSWEGVAAISLKIDQRLAEIAEKASQGILDEMGRAAKQQAQQLSAPTVPFDAQQVRQIADMFVAQQRDLLRAELQASTPNTEVPTPPQMETPVQKQAPTLPDGQVTPATSDIIPELSGK